MSVKMSINLASSTVLIDNDICKLTLWDFAPGQETGWHTHTMDYVVMPNISGTLKLVNKDGTEMEVQVSPDKPYFKTSGVNHNVISVNDFNFSFLEMEFK